MKKAIVSLAVLAMAGGLGFGVADASASYIHKPGGIIVTPPRPTIPPRPRPPAVPDAPLSGPMVLPSEMGN
jgi:hypothetical protein